MIRATPTCFVAALLVVGVAGAAANSASYPDPAGDAGKYPDIVRVDVTEDQTYLGPHLSFWATFSAKQPCGDSGGRLSCSRSTSIRTLTLGARSTEQKPS